MEEERYEVVEPSHMGRLGMADGSALTVEYRKKRTVPPV